MRPVEGRAMRRDSAQLRVGKPIEAQCGRLFTVADTELRCWVCGRKRKATGVDARTPAIWISNGTGRDGAARSGAPKVGWCWARNRHTWLGFASTTDISVT